MLEKRLYSVYFYGYTSFLAQYLIKNFKESNVELFTLPRDFDFKKSIKEFKKKECFGINGLDKQSS